MIKDKQREIKFRIWDTVTSKMIYHDNSCDRSLMICLGGSIFSDDDECRDYRFKLMQYTGLHDKNGKEMWEGDILKFYPNSGVGNSFESFYTYIEFDEGVFGWYDPKTKKQLRWLHSLRINLYEVRDYFENVEVIGNIYENYKLNTKI